MTHVSPVLDYLGQVHAKCASDTSGSVATYIPELAKANPDWFGIAIATSKGAIYEVGDSSQSFTIQSISKPFVYGMALEQHGRTTVLGKVGVEPTGDAFNSISLDPGTGRPRNPMINAGAIAAAGLVPGKTPSAKLKRLMETFSLYAGRELTLDEQVYNSENETGHRNRAIGHMLRNFEILQEDPLPVVQLYFQQCSVSVTCRDLAVMAATLANRGVNPVTGKQAIPGEYVESVLSVMGSCGMYDYAGEWMFNIGMPAKSGVAGGVIAVIPGQLGIGVFSPRLDNRGNSVRGIRACAEISRDLDLHLLNCPNVGEVAMRLKSHGAELASNRVRTPTEAALLREVGSRIHFYQLQGHLFFASFEPVVRDLMQDLDGLDFLLLDFKHVLTVNENVCHLLLQVLRKLADSGKTLLFVHAAHLPLLRRFMRIKLAENFERLHIAFEDKDPALEWCENQLLNRLLPEWTLDQEASPRSYELFEGMTDEEINQLLPLLKRKTFARGEAIVQAGDAPSDLFFLARGHASVYLMLPTGTRKRLATFSAGMAFGEMAVIERAPRSAMVVADTDVECDLLSLEAFDLLTVACPHIKVKLLASLGARLSRRLRDAHRELQAMSR
jgi:glutaminase